MMSKTKTKVFNKKNFTVHYLDEKIKVDIKSSDTILDTSVKNKINHQHICGGLARCSSCRVSVIHGLENCLPRSEKESEVAKNLNLAENIRLACQTKVAGDIAVSKPEFDNIDIELAKLAIREGEKYKYGEEKELTMMFLDIENFTTLVEQMPPFDVVHFLNRFYYHLGEIVTRHNAKIIDYYGDGFLSVFGLEQPETKEYDSVQAGLEIIETVKNVGKVPNNYSCQNLKVRIGAKIGKVIVGTIGSEKLRKFSVMGDAVNTASRIEEMNKDLETLFLVCDNTYKKVMKDFKFGKMFEVDIRGKTGTHIIWEVKTVLA